MFEATKIHLKEALRSLYSSKQRSLLTMIGVVIGVSSMIAMVSTGLIVQAEALRRFEAQGTDVLTITKRVESRKAAKTAITLEDALGLNGLPAVASTAPFLVSSGQVPLPGRNLDVRLFGVTESFAGIRELEAEEGRFISDLDRRRYFCVIGADVAGAMRGAGVPPRLGSTVMVGEVLYTLLGVLRESPRRSFGGIDANKAVFIPFATAQRVFPAPELENVLVRMGRGVGHEDATAQVREYFRLKPKAPEIDVISPLQLIEQMRSQMQLITLLLGAVGGISLLVGGLGVMNVMMATVSERRLEIGIKRALGARRRDVRWQFLLESLILSMFGGVLGIALGLGAAYLISNRNGWAFLVSLEAVGLGFGITVGTGLFFGFYPAWLAARLDPIVALRGK
ncbi:MAG: FtsX-like permease family protein [Nitrospinae bacterium]|nr:FtsX-like permease family protein [Nitrospinota bacterium]